LTTPTQVRLEEALRLADAGYEVIPLTTPVRLPSGKLWCSCGHQCGKQAGKHPDAIVRLGMEPEAKDGPSGASTKSTKKGGLHLATKDPQLIERWFTAPRAERVGPPNIGLRTGTLFGDNRFIAVDVDATDLSTLDDHTRSILAEISDTAPIVQTGSGGFHFYVSVPADMYFHNAVRFLDHTDLRAENGLVVVKGDHYSGGTYKELRAITGNPPQAPLRLMQAYAERALAATKERTGRTQARIDRPSGKNQSYGQAVLDNALTTIAGATEVSHARNDTFSVEAFNVFRNAHIIETRVEDLRELLAAAALSVGLEVPEVERTLRSAERAGLSRPYNRARSPLSTTEARVLQHVQKGVVVQARHPQGGKIFYDETAGPKGAVVTNVVQRLQHLHLVNAASEERPVRETITITKDGEDALMQQQKSTASRSVGDDSSSLGINLSTPGQTPNR